MRQLEELIATGVRLRQLEAATDPGQLAFEIQALLGAGAHQYRLRNDPKAPGRGAAAVLRRLEALEIPVA